MSEDDAVRAVAPVCEEAPPARALEPCPVEASADSLAAAASILAASALPAAANALLTARRRPLERARGWWLAATPNLRGSLLMIAAFTAFAVMMTLIKLAGGRIPLPQILIVRQLVMTLILALVVGRALPRIMHTSRPGLQFLRGMFSLGAMLCGFTALIHLPMAEATALGFAQVLFVTLLAILILREVVDRRRWVALAIGFAGVFVMLRPGGEAMNGYALLAILGALFGAGITISVRVLGQSERTETILFWQGAVVLIALGLPAVFLWTPPTPVEWALMVGIGVVGTRLPDGRGLGAGPARLRPPAAGDGERLSRLRRASQSRHHRRRRPGRWRHDLHDAPQCRRAPPGRHAAAGQPARLTLLPSDPDAKA